MYLFIYVLKTTLQGIFLPHEHVSFVATHFDHFEINNISTFLQVKIDIFMIFQYIISISNRTNV